LVISSIQPPQTTNRWQSFKAGAKAHVARKFWQYRPDFRTRVVEAALNHWPEKLPRSERAAVVDRMFHDASFRRELDLGPITWWLLGLAIRTILWALVDYWFQTQERPESSS